MSVKNREFVERYVSDVQETLSALANLREFVESLPAPENGELWNLHYGHIGSVNEIKRLIGEAMVHADSLTGYPVCPVCVNDHLHTDSDGEYCRNTIGTELVRLSPQGRTVIKNAFYGVADHLKPLADVLEMADLERGGKGGPLLEQHLIVCQMLELFDKLTIGRFV